MLSALIIWKGMPLCHTSSKPAPLPLLSALVPQRVEPPLQPSTVNPPPLTHISALPLAVFTPLPRLSALPLQQGVPPLNPLDVHAPHPLSILIQGIGLPPLLPSAESAYAPLLW